MQSVFFDYWFRITGSSTASKQIFLRIHGRFVIFFNAASSAALRFHCAGGRWNWIQDRYNKLHRVSISDTSITTRERSYPRFIYIILLQTESYHKWYEKELKIIWLIDGLTALLWVQRSEGGRRGGWADRQRAGASLWRLPWHQEVSNQFTSVVDPGSGAVLTPGSGMGKNSGSGSGIKNLDHIAESLETIFWVKILNSLLRIRDQEHGSIPKFTNKPWFLPFNLLTTLSIIFL